MKILLAGGGTGGHFYPLIAVLRSVKRLSETENIAHIEFYITADKNIDPDILVEEQVAFIKISAGKFRRYFSLLHITDSFKTLGGIVSAIFKLYEIMPDVVFSKGGYASFPVLVAARFLGIPVMIHESDAVPGLVSQWSGKWARRIALSFQDSAKYFDPAKSAVIGNPIRSQIVGGNVPEAMQSFNLESDVPIILALGSSQGSEKINDVILQILPDALDKYQIIHQTGKNNISDVLARTNIFLENNSYKSRYHPSAFLNEGEMRNASKVASIVISRASSSIFEIAAWGLPSILIPLPTSAQDHQRENAYAYARIGACEIIEETNLSPHLLLSQINKILSDPTKSREMKISAQNFAKIDAADKIAKELIKLALHDKS